MRKLSPRLAALEAQASAQDNPQAHLQARLERQALRLSSETRRAAIVTLCERLGPDGLARALARGGAEGRRIAAKLGIALTESEAASC